MSDLIFDDERFSEKYQGDDSMNAMNDADSRMIEARLRALPQATGPLPSLLPLLQKSEQKLAAQVASDSRIQSFFKRLFSVVSFMIASVRVKFVPFFLEVFRVICLIHETRDKNNLGPRCLYSKFNFSLFQIEISVGNTFFEVSLDELDHTELAVESLVSTILLDYFSEVMIEEVSIRFPFAAGTSDGVSGTVQLQAQVASSAFALDVDKLEQAIGNALMELFGTLAVARTNFVSLNREEPLFPSKKTGWASF